MIKELIDYHKNKMRLAEAEGRTEDYKFHKAAIEMLSQPTLPSNLDEAANKFAVLYDQGTCDGIVQDCFKAGAEWMAGQGVNADFEVCKLANRAWLTPIDEKRFAQDVFGNFEAGDKVIVQIRKK